MAPYKFGNPEDNAFISRIFPLSSAVYEAA
jgi:hypothetical protein